MPTFLPLPAFVKTLLGVDSPPFEIADAYARLQSMCLRDHPAVDQCTITRDGIYAFFSHTDGNECPRHVNATVVIQIDRQTSTGTVQISLDGTARIGGLDIACDIVNDAFTFAGCCVRQLRSWGMLK